MAIAYKLHPDSATAHNLEMARKCKEATAGRKTPENQ
jgi:hypothetical protein